MNRTGLTSAPSGTGNRGSATNEMPHNEGHLSSPSRKRTSRGSVRLEEVLQSLCRLAAAFEDLHRSPWTFCISNRGSRDKSKTRPGALVATGLLAPTGQLK